MALALVLLSHAASDDVIRVWKVGSPHKGDTPEAAVPPSLSDESTKRGFRLTVETFPAKGFAETFSDALTRNAAPDLLVFDNYGVMNGITTPLGTFEGIGREPAVRRDLIRVTGAFDDLLGPQYGWVYLLSSSRNHTAARMLALSKPGCPMSSSGPQRHPALAEVLPGIATAYLEGDAIGVQRYSDPERVTTVRERLEPVKVGAIRTCGIWGNDRLAFASVNSTYDAETTIGHAQVLLVLRNTYSQWQLLVAARDPVSTGEFVKEVPSIAALLTHDEETGALPIAARLLSPRTGHAPRPAAGQRFGSFRWQVSPSDNVVAELVEFAYHDDARLFLSRGARRESRGEISAGRLWTTRSLWNWRVWSISRAGDVAFSGIWTFPH